MMNKYSGRRRLFILENAYIKEVSSIYFFIFLVLTGFCIFLTIRKKKIFYLAIPFMALFAFLIIQIAMVPAPFFETVKFIFSLR